MKRPMSASKTSRVLCKKDIPYRFKSFSPVILHRTVIAFIFMKSDFEVSVTICTDASVSRASIKTAIRPHELWNGAYRLCLRLR
jgi:hypothetical protein